MNPVQIKCFSKNNVRNLAKTFLYYERVKNKLISISVFINELDTPTSVWLHTRYIQTFSTLFFMAYFKFIINISVCTIHYVTWSGMLTWMVWQSISLTMHFSEARSNHVTEIGTNQLFNHKDKMQSTHI